MEMLGSLIRTRREQLGLLGRELAAKLEIDPGTLSRLENGNYKDTPSPDLVRRLSAALGIHEQQILRAVGYDLLEEGPSYDPDLFVMMESVQTWTPSQRKLLWSFIEAVSAALDKEDPPISTDDDESS